MRFDVVDARWGDVESLELPEYKRITDELLEIDEKTGHKLLRSIPSSLHWSRRFEYPWAILAAGPVDGRRVADIGSGLAPLQFYLAREGAHVTSVDIRHSIVSEIRRNAKSFGDITAQVDDATYLRLPPREFDMVFIISVLEHLARGDIDTVEAAKMAVLEAVRILKPSGMTLITFDVSYAGDRHLTKKEFKEFMAWLDVEVPTLPGRILYSSDTAEGRMMGANIAIFCIAIKKKPLEIALRDKRLVYLVPQADYSRFINVNFHAFNEALKAVDGMEVRSFRDSLDADFILIKDDAIHYEDRPVDLSRLTGLRALLMADVHTAGEVKFGKRVNLIKRWGIRLILTPYLRSPLMDRYRIHLPCDFRLFPWWIDPELFYPAGRRDIDVSFIGIKEPWMRYPLRNIIDDKLRDQDTWIYCGPGRHPGYRFDLNPESKNYVYGRRYADVLRRSRIFLFGNSVYNYPLFKFFEGMACGCLVMAPTPFGARELHLRPGYNFVPINTENFLDKIEYYLENPKEAAKVSKRGCKMVHIYHTAERRVKELMKIVEEYV